MERLDRVQVATAGGVVTLPWSSRFELLERVRRLYGGAEIVRRFEAAGATRPVTLDWDEKTGPPLVQDQAEWGFDELSEIEKWFGNLEPVLAEENKTDIGSPAS